jgi:hypothetical protein
MWTPQYHHVTQIHSDGSGWNDCAEASVARFLMECDLSRQPNDQHWNIVRAVLDPAQPLVGIWALISHLGELGRGEPDQPGQGYTTILGINAMLAAYGIAAQFTDGGVAAYALALAAPWSLCWVDGTVMAPPTHPASYFGNEAGQGNHFMLWLPSYQGRDNVFNDPLSIDPDIYSDAAYTVASVSEAMYGCWVLPNTNHGEDGPEQYHVLAACALKQQPNHLPGVVEVLTAGTLVTATANGTTPNWRQVTAPDGRNGWLLQNNLAQA